MTTFFEGEMPPIDLSQPMSQTEADAIQAQENKNDQLPYMRMLRLQDAIIGAVQEGDPEHARLIAEQQELIEEADMVEFMNGMRKRCQDSAHQANWEAATIGYVYSLDSDRFPVDEAVRIDAVATELGPLVTAQFDRAFGVDSTYLN